MTTLVIVESPNKVRSIAGYLGDGYVVDSSVGHIRDLPRVPTRCRPQFKGETWARLGVNVDSAFEPIYVVSADKKSQMTKLKKLLKEADELVLATDEDREGEAIAWHLLDELKPKVPVKRIVFNEITKDAIQYAIAHPRDVDMDLVDAQETRRILDRLYGYEVSPVLWKKVMSGLSAGRVQSVATRLVVERERERMAFRIASYWDLEATFDAGEGFDPRQFPAKLFSVDGKRVASGNNFDNTGTADLRQGRAPRRGSRPARWPRHSPTSRSRCARSSPSPTRVAPTRRSAPRRCSRRRPASSASAPPARCRSPSGSTRAATSPICVRTPRRCRRPRSTPPAPRSPSSTAPAYLPDEPRVYASKVKNAQEAHEAIRPAGERFKTPDQTGLSGDELRLYELIWKRTIASQMHGRQGQLGVDPHRHDRRRPARTSSSAARAARSRSTDSSRRTSSRTTTPRPRATTSRPSCPTWPRDRPSRLPSSARPATRPSRRRASPRPASSASSRPARSAALRRTRRSSARSRTAATSTRRAPRWCRPGSRSR